MFRRTYQKVLPGCTTLECSEDAVAQTLNHGCDHVNVSPPITQKKICTKTGRPAEQACARFRHLRYTQAVEGTWRGHRNKSYTSAALCMRSAAQIYSPPQWAGTAIPARWRYPGRNTPRTTPTTATATLTTPTTAPPAEEAVAFAVVFLGRQTNAHLGEQIRGGKNSSQLVNGIIVKHETATCLCVHHSRFARLDSRLSSTAPLSTAPREPADKVRLVESWVNLVQATNVNGTHSAMAWAMMRAPPASRATSLLRNVTMIPSSPASTGSPRGAKKALCAASPRHAAPYAIATDLNSRF